MDLHLDADPAGLRCLQLHDRQLGAFCGDALDVRHEGEARPALRAPHVDQHEALGNERAERLTCGFNDAFHGSSNVC